MQGSFYGGVDTRNAEEPNGESVIVPAGQYVVVVTKTERLSKTTGDGVKFTFEVAQGEYMGATAVEFYWRNHTNEKAQSIGRQAVAWMARLAGIYTLQDPEQFINKRLTVDIRPEPFTDKEGKERFSNKVVKFVDNQQQMGQAPQQSYSSAPPPSYANASAPQGTTDAPWARSSS